MIFESGRVNGKRHVASLGSILIPVTAKYILNPAAVSRARAQAFWKRVDERLHKLGNRISSEHRQKIEAALCCKVPRPTKEECEAEKQRNEQELAVTTALRKAYLAARG